MSPPPPHRLHSRLGVSRPSTVVSEVELESDEDGFQQESDDNAEDPFASDEEVRCSSIRYTYWSPIISFRSLLSVVHNIVLSHRAMASCYDIVL